MFQRILLVLDPARDLGAAKQYSLNMVRKWGVAVVGLYPVFEEAAPFKASQGEGIKPHKFVGKEIAKEFEAEIKEECGPDVDCTVVVEEGPYEVTIPNVAAREDVDLVVLGSFHSKTGRTLVGSDIERIIEYSPCSILIVRTRKTPPEPGSLLAFAHDGKAVSPKAVHWVVKFSQEVGTVVHPVVGVPPRALEEGKRTANDFVAEMLNSGVETEPPHVLTSRWILGPHGVVHRAVAGLHPAIAVLSRFQDVAQGNATHWLVHEFVADTPCPTLILK
ncbi:MAG: universal stress protein [Thermoplasmata archaeon]|nr:MAG: universal stress protein [Thermoplasmata archaeon]